MESLTFVRSHVQSGSAVFILDFLHSGFSLLAHNHCRVALAMLVMGVMRCGFSTSVLDGVQTESATLVQSFSRLGSVASILDFLRLGLPASARNHAYFGFVSLVVGMACSESILLVIDAVHPEPSLFLRSMA